MVPTHQVRQAVQLVRTLTPPGCVPSGEVLRDVAARAGVNPRTVRRWVDADTAASAARAAAGGYPDDGRTSVFDCTADAAAAGGGRRTARWVPTRAQLAVVAASPNLAEARRDLLSTDPAVPSYATFRRAVGRIDSGIAAFVTRKGGAPALINNRLYLKINPAHRNTRWVMDSQQVPVLVTSASHPIPRKYWQTTAEDEATRMVMATVITAERPTSDDVVACIAAGIRGITHPDGSFVGGVPDEICWDNAMEFLSEQVTQMALKLAFTGTAVTPWAPYEKGKIESWHRTVQNELYAKLPGYTHGPRSFSQKHLWVPEARDLVTDAMLVARAQMWVEHYNTARPHSGIGGLTPLQRWNADPTPLRLVDDEVLYEGMLRADRTRKVSKNGIRFRTIDYIAPELNGRVGRRVHVRYLPHDTTFIEVFDDRGEHIATAYDADRLRPEQRVELLMARRDQYGQAKALMAEAARLRTQRYEDDIAAQANVPGALSRLAPAGPHAENLRALQDLLADEPEPDDAREPFDEDAANLDDPDTAEVQDPDVDEDPDADDEPADEETDEVLVTPPVVDLAGLAALFDQPTTPAPATDTDRNGAVS